MTDYIEEMMRTAGMKGCSKELLFIGESPYPLFLGKQQLEIIKLIDGFCYNPYGKNYPVMACNPSVGDINTLYFEYEIEMKNQKFSKALAQLTTELMKAGELDKEKVRKVLES